MPAFMKLGDIKGEVTAEGFEKWIELLSYSWGATQSGGSHSGGGGGAGKVSFQDFHFASSTSTASPQMAEAMCQGKVFPKVELQVVGMSDDNRYRVFLKYELTNVLISSYQMGGSGNEIPVDSVDLRLEAAILNVGDTTGVVGGCGKSGR